MNITQTGQFEIVVYREKLTQRLGEASALLILTEGVSDDVFQDATESYIPRMSALQNSLRQDAKENPELEQASICAGDFRVLADRSKQNWIQRLASTILEIEGLLDGQPKSST